MVMTSTELGKASLAERALCFVRDALAYANDDE